MDKMNERLFTAHTHGTLRKEILLLKLVKNAGSTIEFKVSSENSNNKKNSLSKTKGNAVNNRQLEYNKKSAFIMEGSL